MRKRKWNATTAASAVTLDDVKVVAATCKRSKETPASATAACRKCGETRPVRFHADSQCFECVGCHAFAGTIVLRDDADRLANRVVDASGRPLSRLPDALVDDLLRDDEDDHPAAADDDALSTVATLVCDATSVAASTTTATPPTTADGRHNEALRNFVRTRQAPTLPMSVAHDCVDAWAQVRAKLQRIIGASSVQAAVVECVCRRRGLTRPRDEICAFFGIEAGQLREARARLVKHGIALDVDRVRATMGLVDHYLVHWLHADRLMDDDLSASANMPISLAAHPDLDPLRRAAARLVQLYYDRAAVAATATSSSASAMSASSSDGDGDEDDDDEVVGMECKEAVAAATMTACLPTLAVKEATVAATCLYAATIQTRIDRIAAGSGGTGSLRRGGTVLNRDFLTRSMKVSLKALNMCLERLRAVGVVMCGDDWKARKAGGGRRKTAGRSILSISLSTVQSSLSKSSSPVAPLEAAVPVFSQDPWSTLAAAAAPTDTVPMDVSG